MQANEIVTKISWTLFSFFLLLFKTLRAVLKDKLDNKMELRAKNKNEAK